MKKSIALLSILSFALVLSAPVYAEGGQCPVGKHDCGKKADCGKGHDCGKKSSCPEAGGCPVTAKFMKKAAFILDNKETLSLSADQVKTVKALKHEVEKASVRQNADMQIFMLDIMAKLHEEPIDVEGANAIIDKGSAGMSEGVKSIVAAYAKLKDTLTAEQVAKAKQLHSKKS